MIRITEQQVRENISMPVAMDLVEEAFLRIGDGRAINQPRRRVAMPNKTLLHYMAAGDIVDGFVGTKVYASNPKVGALDFEILLFDANSARLVATIEANALGQIRTGAASGVATRQMALKGACNLALFGSGYQAQTQLEAVACARKLASARVYSRHAERRERFAERMAEQLGLDVKAVGSPEEALEGADIVTTITSSRTPVFPGELLEAGAHINAAGSNHVMRRELDAETIRRTALVAVDSLEQAQMECGDLAQAVEEGIRSWDDVWEISTVLAVNLASRSFGYKITLFESQGLAIQDIALAAYLYRKLG